MVKRNYAEALGGSSIASEGGGCSEPASKQVHVAFVEDWRSVSAFSSYRRDRNGQTSWEMVELYGAALSMGWRKDQRIQQADGKGHRFASLHVTLLMWMRRAPLQRCGALLQAGLWGVVATCRDPKWIGGNNSMKMLWMVQQRRKKECERNCKILHRSCNLGISVTWGGDSSCHTLPQVWHKSLVSCDPPAIPEWQHAVIQNGLVATTA